MKVKNTRKCAAAEVDANCTVSTVARKKPGRKAVPGKDVVFTYHAEKGKSVYVAGEFNNWDPTAKQLVWKARQGIYTTTMKLPFGTYQYKFVIDGIWCADPENADSVANDQGTFNSVITVKEA